MKLSNRLKKIEQWKSQQIHATILLLCKMLIMIATHCSADTTDQLALLSFKSLLHDPYGALQSWNTTLSLCQWRGITCGQGNYTEKVIALELNSLSLTGPISPHLANLTSLQRLEVSANHLQGGIPSELGRLRNLRYLNLSYNSLGSNIPRNLSSQLRVINLSFNMLSGAIPGEFGSLSSLTVLNLGDNSLTGNIPPSLGNISTLTSILFYDAGLSGSIPDSIGKLKNLKIFQVASNKLSGKIPYSLYNISSMQYFTAGENSLEGTLPTEMFDTLPRLQMLILDTNRLYGPIPASLPNASKLVEFDIQINHFSGMVPSRLGGLLSLYWMNLNSNWLDAKGANGWDFFTSLTNCSRLGTLGLSNNRLGGTLPNSVANLSVHLDLLAIGENQMAGSIPEGIGNLVNLTVLILNKNRLRGSIPESIGRLWKLHVLALSDNNFDGEIPSSIGNLSQLNQVDLRASGVSGSIPASFGSCKRMEVLDLSHNKLSGAIPRELVSIASLSRSLDLSNNFLTGALPSAVGELHNLAELDVSENKMSSEIPRGIGDCQSLERLYMQGNFFQGAIPQSLGSLKGLQELDLSRNNLSGSIPNFLGMLGSLMQLNLSFNNLEGEVPNGGIFSNASAISILGNNKLCGGNPQLHLQECGTNSSGKNHLSLTLKIVIPLVSMAVCFIIISFVWFVMRHMRKPRKTSSVTYSADDQFTKVSYAELLSATNEFSVTNLIGAGNFGSVYKGILSPNERIVAVKVLDLQKHGASKSFMAECEALRNVRHRNLVKIITVCSSLDFQGNEFKAIVLPYMPNGSLEKWLHPEIHEHSETRNLSLYERLNIAMDVASALDYLHHHGHTPIVHCDLKPSNVLLDENMCAHVSDFGLAKFLYDKVPDSEEHSTKSAGVKGTIGYVAPEYGMVGQISTYGDVYSYGILLLELFTGKRPTDDIFNNGLNLHKYVETAIPTCVFDIMDPLLLLCEDGKSAQSKIQKKQEAGMEMKACLVSIMRVGLVCSNEDPKERISMGHAVKELHTIRDMFRGIDTEKEITECSTRW